MESGSTPPAVFMKLEDFHPHLLSVKGIRGRAYYEEKKKKLESFVDDFAIDLPGIFADDHTLRVKTCRKILEAKGKEPEPYKPQFNDEGYTEAEKMKLNMELIEITYDLFPFLDEEIQPRLGKDSDEILEPKTKAEELRSIMEKFKQLREQGDRSLLHESTNVALVELLPRVHQLDENVLVSTPRKDRPRTDDLDHSGLIDLDISDITSGDSVDHSSGQPELSIGTDDSFAAAVDALKQDPEANAQHEAPSTDQLGNDREGSDSARPDDSNPKLMEFCGVRCWVFWKGFIKPTLGKVETVNVRTLTSVMLASLLLQHRHLLEFPVDEILPSSWADRLNSAVRGAEKIYTEAPRECSFLTKQKTVALLHQRGIDVLFGKTQRVRIRDRDSASTLRLKLYEFASGGEEFSVALYYFNSGVYIFVHSEGKGVFFIDLFCNWPYGGTALIHCPGDGDEQWKQFLNSIKTFAGMDIDMFGEFIPLRSA